MTRLMRQLWPSVRGKKGQRAHWLILAPEPRRLDHRRPNPAAGARFPGCIPPRRYRGGWLPGRESLPTIVELSIEYLARQDGGEGRSNAFQKQQQSDISEEETAGGLGAAVRPVRSMGI